MPSSSGNGRTARSWCARTTADCCAPTRWPREAEGFVAWDEGRGLPLAYRHRFTVGSNSRRCGLHCAAGSSSPAVMARSPAVPPSTSMPRSAARCRPTSRCRDLRRRADAIREAARLLWQHRPVAHYTWTGLEQQSNATQTDRAIAILHALTGSIDVAGWQSAFRAGAGQRRVRHRTARPGAMAQGARSGRAPARAGPIGLDPSDDLYRAIVDAEPYQVRGAGRVRRSICCCRTLMPRAAPRRCGSSNFTSRPTCI